jgi:hypothetical protein
LEAIGDLDAYLSAHEAHAAAKAAHAKAVREAVAPLHVQLQGLQHLSSSASKECRESGFGGDDFQLGVGVVPEHVHRYYEGSRSLEDVMRKADGGALTAQECRAMIELLGIPEPEHNSLVRGNIKHLRADQFEPNGAWVTRKWREIADGIERLEPVETAIRGARDVERYVAERTGGLPLMGAPQSLGAAAVKVAAVKVERTIDTREGDK